MRSVLQLLIVMKPYRFVVFMLTVASLAVAQSVPVNSPIPAVADAAITDSGATAEAKADQAWATLIDRGSPMALPWATVSNGPDGLKISRTPKKSLQDMQDDRAKRVGDYRSAADAAKQFYTTYPNHENAADAKKLEVTWSLLGVTDDNKAQEHAALQLAQQFRTDKANASAARFEVAVLAERVQARVKTGGIFKNDPAELERIADKLRAEFGDLPEACQFYVSVARAADRTTAARMAKKLLSLSAPSSVQAEAHSILDREGLVGQPLSIRLPTIDGKIVDLSKQTGKVTILYIWSSLADGRSLPGLAAAAKMLPAGAQVVYLCISGSGEKLKQLEAEAPIPGIHCFELTASANPAAAMLKIGQVPYVYILDRASRVSDFGPADWLPRLLAAAQ